MEDRRCIPVIKKKNSVPVATYQTLAVIGLVLGMVGPVAVCCDLVR